MMEEEEEGSRVGEIWQLKFSSKEIAAVEPWEWN